MSENGHQTDKKSSAGVDVDPREDEMHFPAGLETPLRDDAFELDDEEKVQRITAHFKEIMETLGLDLTNDSLEGTPERVARLYVQELFKGLQPAQKPEIRVFENSYQYGEMLIEKNISVQSACEHHFLPMTGKAHVAYISDGHVIGLSKINRIVDYYARRPQVQERLTRQIAQEMKQALNTEDVAVFMECRHYCVIMRGANDTGSTTVTTSFTGQFEQENLKKQFFDAIRMEMKGD